MGLEKILLENKDKLKKLGYLNLEDRKIFAVFDEYGNGIVVQDAWAYISKTGMILSEYLEDGRPRDSLCGEKQKVEILCLFSSNTSGYSKTLEVKNNISQKNMSNI